MKDGFLQLSDVLIHYTESGSGEPFLFLHGNEEDASYFAKQTEYFSAHYRVIALDTRAHGKSGRGNKPLTFETLSDDVRDAMDLLGLAKAHILGFSDGGNTAIMLTLKYPQKVESLLLNGANLNPFGMKCSVLAGIFLEYTILSFASLFKEELRSKKEIVSLMAQQPHIDPKELKHIMIPTSVIVGQHDMIRTAHSALIAEAIPNAVLITISDADHFVAAKHPGCFNEIVEQFLKNV